MYANKEPVYSEPTEKKMPLPNAPVEAPLYMTSEEKAPLPDGDVNREETYETIGEMPTKPEYVMDPPPYSELA